MAYITRLKDLMNTLSNHKKDTVFVCERSTDTDHYVFAKMLYESGKIREIDWQIYQQYVYTFTDKYKVNGVVYVKTQPEICLERIKKRNRSGEEVVPLDYLRNCHNYHTHWLEEPEWESKVFTLDSTPDTNDDSYWIEQEKNITKFITKMQRKY